MSSFFERSDRRPALLGSASLVAVSWGLAAAYVAANDWFNVGDLRAFAFWCILLALPAYPVLRIFDRRSARWRPLVVYLAAVAFGMLAGIASTLAVGAILGAWIGAFGFPVFLCWLAGSLSAFVSVALSRRPSSWPVALAAVLVPAVATVVVLRVAFAPPPDLLIHLKPDVSAEKIETIWKDVLGEPEPSSRGHLFIEGVRAVSRFDGEGEARFRVSFQPGTSAGRRAEVVERVRASPLVARTTDLEASGGREFSGNPSPSTGSR